MLKFYNTLTRKKEIFKSRKTNKVNLFVCGPTVYDWAHLGHAKTYIAFDVIVKYFYNDIDATKIIIRETSYLYDIGKIASKRIKDIRASMEKKIQTLFKMHKYDDVLNEKFSETEAAEICFTIMEGMIRRILMSPENNPDKSANVILKFLKMAFSK